jgi:hypothetical protein
MSLQCLFGLHRRSLTAITMRSGSYASLCQSCGRPMVKSEKGKWVLPDPLA